MAGIWTTVHCKIFNFFKQKNSFLSLTEGRVYRSGLVQAYSIHLINMYIFTGNQSINDATNSSTLWVDITVDIRDNIEEEYPEDTLKKQYHRDTFTNSIAMNTAQWIRQYYRYEYCPVNIAVLSNYVNNVIPKYCLRYGQ